GAPIMQGLFVAAAESLSEITGGNFEASQDSILRSGPVKLGGVLILYVPLKVPTNEISVQSDASVGVTKDSFKFKSFRVVIVIVEHGHTHGISRNDLTVGGSFTGVVFANLHSEIGVLNIKLMARPHQSSA